MTTTTRSATSLRALRATSFAVRVVALAALAASSPSLAHAETYKCTETWGGETSVEYTNIWKGPHCRSLSGDSGSSRRVERVTLRSFDDNGSGIARHRGGVTDTVRKADLEEYLPHIREAARLHDIPVALILAVITAESDFDRNAVSPKGAQGLMQLMPGTASDMGVIDAFDPRDNILGGTKYLRYLANKFGGTPRLIVAAYNAGHGRVERVKGVPAIAETRDYVRKVLKLYRHYTDNPEALVTVADLNRPTPRTPARDDRRG